MLYERNGPFLQSFWENSVVRVAKCLMDDAPRFVPVKTFEIKQDAHQLRNSKRGMRVV